jgi:phytoene dehydrogenase-like protein
VVPVAVAHHRRRRRNRALSTYDVIVVGAGPGGLTCAGRLANWGVRTLLVERSEHVGGKAVAGTRDGFRFELGPKLQVPMRGHAFERLFDELGISEKLGAIIPGPSTSAYRRAGSSEWIVTTGEDRERQGGQALTPFELWGLDERQRDAAVGIMAEMVSLTREQLDELDDVSMQEYLSRFPDVPGPLYNNMGMHANASLAEPIDRVAASEQIKIMQQLAADPGAGYYRGGFGRMLEDIAEAFVARGGELRTGAEVRSIDVDDEHVVGVTTADATFSAPVVVSDAGIQPTVLKLAGPEHFPSEYVAYVRALEPGWGWASVRYFLDRKVVDSPMCMFYAEESWYTTERYARVRNGEEPEDVIVFVTVPSAMDPSMAPPGKECVVAGTICSPDPEAPEIPMLYRKVDEMMERIFPGFMDSVEHRATDGPAEVSAHTRDSVVPGAGGECVGIGQVVGQCGTKKPSPVSPVAGLYFCGADAGSEGMGTHQAGDSGLRVAAMVRDATKVRRGSA